VIEVPIKLIETDVTIDYLRNTNEKVKNSINDLIDQGYNLKITQITASELWFGVYRLKSKEKRISESKKLNKFFLGFPDILTMDNNASRIYGEICAELEKIGQKVPQFDLLNASIAISNQVSLITRDRKHFPRINNLSEFDFLELWE
jgi:tRNA(fMet)-specific endonuclease VapC